MTLRRFVLWAALAIGALFALPNTVRAEDPVPTTDAFAIIVGANRSPTAGVAPLHFADDDALANQRVLELFGAKTSVLVSLDEETQQLFPASAVYRAPTQADLASVFKDVQRQVAESRAQNRKATLYFFFAGHGDMLGDRTFLQLQDARLWPSDLANALTRVNAHQTHVVIDACYGSQFVAARGPGGRRTAIAPGFSHDGNPKWPANTGFLTARSASGQTHEWVEFQAGIFSHEARSGMVGGADVDLDGNITYRELAAFVARANASVANHKYRPLVIASPPNDDLDAPLVRLPTGSMLLDLDKSAGSRLFVETEAGIRWADVHPAQGQNLRIVLPVDLGPLFVMRSDPEAEFKVAPNPGLVRFSDQEPTAPRVRARGAAHEAFRQLFALPFNRADASAYVAVKEDARPSDQRSAFAKRPWLWAITGLGGATALAGGAFGISAYGLSDQEGGTGVERKNLGDKIDSRNNTAAILIGSGLVVAAIGAAALWWQGRSEVEGDE